MNEQRFLVHQERYFNYESAKEAVKRYSQMPDVQVLMGFPDDGSYEVKVYELRESEWVL